MVKGLGTNGSAHLIAGAGAVVFLFPNSTDYWVIFVKANSVEKQKNAGLGNPAALFTKLTGDTCS